MFTILKKCPSHALVKGSATVHCVTVSLNPQSQPLELYFSSVDDALSFVSRIQQEDGEQFVVSLLSYQSKASKSLE